MEIKIIGNESSNRMKLLKNVGKALEKVKGKISVSLLEDEGTEKEAGEEEPRPHRGQRREPARRGLQCGYQR